MSVSVKNYREVSRNYLLRVIEKQKQGVTSYPISLFDNKLAEKSVDFLMNTKTLFGGDKKFVQKLLVAYTLQSTNMIINERCDRVHLINLLEEPGNCMRCYYCRFLRKLRNTLQKSSFFTSNAHVKNWDIKYKNNVLTVEPVALSSSLVDNGIIQNKHSKK